MIIGILLSVFIDKFLWKTGTWAIHSVLELICVVFNMSLFFIVWNKYDSSSTSSKLIAFGLLSTTIFDILHIYYFEPLGISITNSSDLAPRFWVLGRITEISMIFIASFNFKNNRIKLGKELSLIISLLLPIAISYININYHDMFPILYNNKGLTPDKIILELAIIILAIGSLLRHKNKIKERGYISYKYLALALLVIVPTEICFMLYKTSASSIVVYGHVFRIIYCYFLHKSIFQGSINYTYEELERSRKRLSDILDAIPIGIKTFDSNSKLDFANKEFENLFGCRREELIGLSSNEINNIFKNKNVQNIVEENKETRNIIGTFTRKDGKAIKLQIDTQKIEDGIL